LLSSTIDINQLSFKATQSYLSVGPKDQKGFNVVIAFLREMSFAYHSFLPLHLRSFRVVIRNRHYTATTSDIYEDLVTLGHTITRT
jgi:hypothetical protein